MSSNTRSGFVRRRSSRAAEADCAAPATSNPSILSTNCWLIWLTTGSSSTTSTLSLRNTLSPARSPGGFTPAGQALSISGEPDDEPAANPNLALQIQGSTQPGDLQHHQG